MNTEVGLGEGPGDLGTDVLPPEEKDVTDVGKLKEILLVDLIKPP